MMVSNNDKELLTLLESRYLSGYKWVAYMNNGYERPHFFKDSIEALQFCGTFAKGMDIDRKGANFFVYIPIHNILSALKVIPNFLSAADNAERIVRYFKGLPVSPVYPQSMADLISQLAFGRIALLEVRKHLVPSDFIDNYYVVVNSCVRNKEANSAVNTITGMFKNYQDAYNAFKDEMSRTNPKNRNADVRLVLAGSFTNTMLQLNENGRCHLFSGINFDEINLSSGGLSISRKVNPFDQIDFPQNLYCRINPDTNGPDFLDFDLQPLNLNSSMRGVPEFLFDGCDTRLIDNFRKHKLTARPDQNLARGKRR